MDAVARSIPPDSPEAVFEDGLGRRVWLPGIADERGTHVLALQPSFATVPSFEFALRERTARLATFHHPGYARVRTVAHGVGPGPSLSVVSDAAPGLRVSDLLNRARERRVPIDIHASLCMIRQLVGAAVALHDSVHGATHGAVAPERLVLTPQARLLVVEHSLGAALERLRYSPERYWSELRIPLPSSGAAPKFDDRADVLQIAVVALSLVRGRLLQTEEFPAHLADVVASTWAVSADGGFEPLPPGLRRWLLRALQLDVDRSFASAVEAQNALDVVLGAGELLASPTSLEALLARYQAAAADPEAPKTTARARMALAPVHIDNPSDHVVVIAAGWGREPADAATPDQAPRRRLDLAPGPDATRVVSSGASEWSRVKRFGTMAAMAATVAVMVAGITVAARVTARSAARPAMGTLELASAPAGAEAYVDGRLRGRTPMTLALDVGSHSIELRGAGQRQTMSVSIKPGAKVSQFVRMPRRRPEPTP